MVDEPDNEDTSKLELPSLSLRRRKKPQPQPQPEPEPEPEDRTPFRLPSLPPLAARTAALVTGLVVGLLGALLTWVSQEGCNLVRGTQTCGGGPGLLLLVVILVVMVLLGGVVLAALHVPEPRGTSFLGVGVLCVVVLLTISGRLDSVWMLLVVPVLTGLAFALAHWVTTTFVEPVPERGPEHDVR